ncbi:MAG: hypothetical protein WC647_06480 [Desulfomonilaceae bacterium]|jgi:hypothetical protein
MNIPLMDKRVRSLEEMMADLIATSENTSRIAAQTSLEMAAFKEEMKDEMKQFRDEMSFQNHKFNKKLGEIANKQGRMAEDLVAPSICRILQEVVGCAGSCNCIKSERVERFHSKDRSRRKEFDVIAECGEYVMVTETKSKLRPTDIPELLDTISDFREYFPEHKSKRIIGSLASLYADESLIKYASRHGILVLAVGTELMDVMNEPGFKPTEF